MSLIETIFNQPNAPRSDVMLAGKADTTEVLRLIDKKNGTDKAKNIFQDRTVYIQALYLRAKAYGGLCKQSLAQKDKEKANELTDGL